ncbi:hypothetical protein HPP92_013921 [Vanilla planifolia]|uniref:CTLH domain-containing protein n=1 Tax=Vanilla planifolia TaxID=51239 RepID=A0A835QPB2_VANPL|nr:hypothetical protein HPP92_013921 [Vanilla planifolia]
MSCFLTNLNQQNYQHVSSRSDACIWASIALVASLLFSLLSLYRYYRFPKALELGVYKPKGKWKLIHVPWKGFGLPSSPALTDISTPSVHLKIHGEHGFGGLEVLIIVVDLSLPNHSSQPGSIVPLGGQMARCLATEGKEEMVGSKGVINRVEFVRIITKTLYSLGYERSGKALEEESGIHLHSSSVNYFRKQVLDGNWDESVETLQKIGLDEHIQNSATFLILEYKFFDLMARDMHGLLELANFRIDSGELRLKLMDELQKLFPPAIMIPERRLENLVEQALNVQTEACFFHNSLGTSLSLYTDHQCGKDQLPSKTLQILQGHDGEVWFLQFSHDGKYLASSSNDRAVIIWEVHEDGEVSLKRILKGHEKPVLMVAWSPDNRYVLSCGMEEVTGAYLLWNLEGKEVENLLGHHMTKNSDLAVAKDGKQIISMCKDNAILLLDRDRKMEKLIEEDQTITSFSLSRDEKLLLVNLLNEEIHLWSIVDVPMLLTKYRGHRRSRFVIRSCFGGFGQTFIASGSEDSQVYIWHRGSGELIQALAGHSGAVNCVSWNPANPQILASGSDDHTIRVWGLNRMNLNRKDSSSNGFACHCNGTSK